MRFAVALHCGAMSSLFAAALVFAWLHTLAWRFDSLPGAVPLTGLRALTLLLIVIFLLRPVAFVQATGARDSVVAVLVDVSRSMRLADEGSPRIEQARASWRRRFRSRSAGTFGPSSSRLANRSSAPRRLSLSADARRSDLSGALTALVDRYRGQRLAGVVVLSDGGDTVDAGSRHDGVARCAGVHGRRRAADRSLAIARSSTSLPGSRCCRNRRWISA